MSFQQYVERILSTTLIKVTNEVLYSPAQTRTGHQVLIPYPTALAPLSLRCGIGQLTRMTFDMLADDVLLEIFDFFVKEQGMHKWVRLAHVCRRWRNVVFQSPHRLDLRLICTDKTPARNALDIWPPLPLIIIFGYFNYVNNTRLDNLIAALEHNDRVCRIEFNSSWSRPLQAVTESAAMQKPFPQLTDLRICDAVERWEGPIRPVPNSFLGGSAPRLRSLYLENIAFPGLAPNLLLSATHLVHLELYRITSAGYIPLEAIATSLTALNSLESLRLHFRGPRPRPALESRRPPPPLQTRSILPILTKIRFQGVSEYLAGILARIDAPRLNELDITFFNQIIFDTPQLFQFISRSPILSAPEKGHITFNYDAVSIRFPSQTPDYGKLGVRIPCTTSEWQLSSLEQVCTSSLPPFSTLEDLYIFEDQEFPPCWQDDIENTLWQELLQPFAVVKYLYLCENVMPRIAPALQELVGGRATEVLPNLEKIFLEEFLPTGPFRRLHEGIEKFVAARRLAGHPLTVSRWDKDWRWDVEWRRETSVR